MDTRLSQRFTARSTWGLCIAVWLFCVRMWFDLTWKRRVVQVADTARYRSVQNWQLLTIQLLERENYCWLGRAWASSTLAWLHCGSACVCLLACLLASLRPYTVNFKWAHLNISRRLVSCQLVLSPGQIFRVRPVDSLKNRVWTLSLRKLEHVYIWRSVNWVIVGAYIISFQQRLLCCQKLCKLAGYLWWRIMQSTLPERSDWCDNMPICTYNYIPVLPVNVSSTQMCHYKTLNQQILRCSLRLAPRWCMNHLTSIIR